MLLREENDRLFYKKIPAPTIGREIGNTEAITCDYSQYFMIIGNFCKFFRYLGTFCKCLKKKIHQGEKLQKQIQKQNKTKTRKQENKKTKKQKTEKYNVSRPLNDRGLVFDAGTPPTGSISPAMSPGFPFP